MSIHEDRSTRSDAPPSLDKVARKLQSTRDQVRTLIDKIILMENLDVVRTIKINELESMVLSQQRETAELSLSLAELRQQVVNGKEHDDEYDNMSNRSVDSLDSALQNLKISEHIDDGAVNRSKNPLPPYQSKAGGIQETQSVERYTGLNQQTQWPTNDPDATPTTAAQYVVFY